MSDSADAAAEANDMRVISRKLHRSNLVLQDHNILVEYRNAPNERLRVGRAIRRIRASCRA
jgi:hypothetical protein